MTRWAMTWEEEPREVRGSFSDKGLITFFSKASAPVTRPDFLTGLGSSMRSESMRS